MKTILIYDVAAETSGAATILEMYHKRYLKEKEIQTYFVTSKMVLSENSNVHLIRLPWVKKSWFHRLFCDLLYIQKIVRKYQVDEIINLQNVAIPFVSVPQTIYLHNAIPISDYNFNFRTETTLWMYKKIIGKITIHNLRYANCVIVQAQWIKNELITHFNIDQTKIAVERVKSTFEVVSSDRIKTNTCIFFYPSSSASYKNHKVIIDACDLLKANGVFDYKVVFTLDTKNDVASQKIKQVTNNKDLPIEYIGTLNHEQMDNMYRKTVLLFPSCLETVGLPLIEAKQYAARIIVANMPYAHEAIGNYSNVLYFDYKDSQALYCIMRDTINSFYGIEESNYEESNNSGRI